MTGHVFHMYTLKKKGGSMEPPEPPLAMPLPSVLCEHGELQCNLKSAMGRGGEGGGDYNSIVLEVGFPSPMVQWCIMMFMNKANK